jgi:hypothetical protein
MRVQNSEKLESKMFKAFCMTIAAREEQIIRIQAHSPCPELNEALETSLRAEVLKATQCTLESALVEEVQQHLSQIVGQNRPRCSGYFRRTLNSQYGQIQGLAVPKLRYRNGQRNWQILERYQRSLGSLIKNPAASRRGIESLCLTRFAVRLRSTTPFGRCNSVRRKRRGIRPSTEIKLCLSFLAVEEGADTGGTPKPVAMRVKSLWMGLMRSLGRVLNSSGNV